MTFAALGIVSDKPAVVKPADEAAVALPVLVAALDIEAAAFVVAAALDVVAATLLAALDVAAALEAAAGAAVDDAPVVTAAVPPQALKASAAEAPSRPATNRRRGREWAKSDVAMFLAFPFRIRALSSHAARTIARRAQ